RQDRWTCSLMLSIGGGLPRAKGGSAPALPVSRPAWRSLALRPACSPSRHCDPLHRRLQRLRYLHRCFDCYRAERTSSRAGLPPAVDQRLFTAHSRARLQKLRRTPGGGIMAEATAKKLIALEGATFSMKEKQLMMGGSDEVIDIPVPTFLVEHAKGLVLFDT